MPTSFQNRFKVGSAPGRKSELGSVLPELILPLVSGFTALFAAAVSRLTAPEDRRRLVTVVAGERDDRKCRSILRPTTVSVGPGCPRSHPHVTVTDETGTGYGPKATIPGQVWVRRLQPVLPVV